MNSIQANGPEEIPVHHSPPAQRSRPFVAAILIILGLGALAGMGIGFYFSASSLATFIVGGLIGQAILVACLFALVIRGIVMCFRGHALSANPRQQ